MDSKTAKTSLKNNPKIMDIIYSSKKTYLKSHGGTVTVHGESMQPILKEGWKLIIEPVKPRQIQLGDIIVFGRNSLTCHRYIGKISVLGKTYLYHKGDNAHSPGILTAKDLAGRVKKVIDESGTTIDKKIWGKPGTTHIGVMKYIYLPIQIFHEIISTLTRKSNTRSDYPES